MSSILDVKRLKISFRTNNGTVKAVRDISFSLEKGKTLAIVGESGSGKSVTSRAILGISAGNAIIESGQIIYDGQDLIRCSEQDMYHIRGDKIAMVFQDPLSSLNPIVRVGKQLTEGMLYKNKAIRKESKKNFNEKLEILRTAMHMAAKEDKELDDSRIDSLIKEFDSFNIVSNKLENSFNQSRDASLKIISDIKDLILLLEHGQKIDIKTSVNSLLKSLEKINDQYFVSSIKDDLTKYINEIKAIKIIKVKGIKADNEKNALSNANLLLLKEMVVFFEGVLAREEINFSSLGYYISKNKDANLSNLAFDEINKQTLDLLEKEFLPEFRKYTESALKFNVYHALEYKKQTVEELVKFKEYVQSNFEKKEFIERVKKFAPIVKNSIEPLKTQKDSTAFILVNGLISLVKKYFDSINSNKKDEKRFNRQMAKFNALKEKGKTIDYQVIPQKIVSLDDIVSDMISLIDSVIDKYNSTISKFGDKKYQKWEKITNLLLEYFKKTASQVVDVLTNTAAKEKAIKLMEEVAIPEARARFRQYPFEFSGGMRQRIVIAIALSTNPEILICDEPTTALDVTIQSQILELINSLKKNRSLSIIFITHDLGVVANMADNIAVMYAGKIVEYGTSEDIFYSPAHPYTWALLSSMPDLDTKDKLEAIPGTPPNMIYPPKGDAFAARNKYALKIDFEEQPPMFKISETHSAATWLLDPRAPKVEMPKVIKDRIARMKRKNAKGGL